MEIFSENLIMLQQLRARRKMDAKAFWLSLVVSLVGWTMFFID